MFVFAPMVQCGLVVWPTGNPGPGFSVLPPMSCSVPHGLGLAGFGQGFLIWEIGSLPDCQAQCLEVEKLQRGEGHCYNQSKTVLGEQSIQGVFILLAYFTSNTDPLCSYSAFICFVEVPDNPGSLERGGSVCGVHMGSSIYCRSLPVSGLWWEPSPHAQHHPSLSHSLFFFLSLRIYIVVLDFMISTTSFLYLSQNDIIFTYHKARYSNILKVLSKCAHFENRTPPPLKSGATWSRSV